MKTFLCIEDGEKFTIKSESMEQAKKDVVVWNTEVIKEITKKDELNSK